MLLRGGWVLLWGSVFCCVLWGAQSPVGVCSLRESPWQFHTKQVVVEGFVFSGFESFTLQDPACRAELGIWLEYSKSALISNEPWRRLQQLIRRHSTVMVKARMRGRFLAGANGQLKGYGHLGCCSLFAVEEVLAVDDEQSEEWDYAAGPRGAAPMSQKSGCRFRESLRVWNWGAKMLAEQRAAEQAGVSWVYTDPERVAQRALEQLVPAPRGGGFVLDYSGPGRREYSWRAARGGSNRTIRLVLSKPRWLSYFARDARRGPWMLVNAWAEDCPQ